MAENDLRQFMHELLARFEKLADGMQAQLSAQTAALGAQTAALGAQTIAMREQATAMREQAATMRKQGKTMEDLGDAVRAHEQGLMSILDHLRRTDGTT